MKNYIELLKDIKENGVLKESRAGDTLSVFVRQLRWNMNDGFPLMTLKKVSFHNVAHELLWFLGAFDDEWKNFGNTNIRYLVDHNVNIWNDDAYRGYLEKINSYYEKYDEPDFYNMVDDPIKNELRPMNKEEFIKTIKNDDEFSLEFGELGETYGAQWRRWAHYFQDGEYSYGYELIDQIQKVIDNLKSNPLSRRHLVTAWNPSVVDDLVLAPCHYGFTLNANPITPRRRLEYAKKEMNLQLLPGVRSSKQWDEWCDVHAVPKYNLSLKWNQRSVDTVLGLPYNVTSYATMLYIISHFTNMIPNDLVCSLEDTHIYTNQLHAVDEMISRENAHPELPTFELVNMENVETIDDIRFGNLKINDYHPLSTIKAPLSVGL